MGRLIAFVLGGADSVWTDLAAAQALVGHDLMIGCNHAARDYGGRLDHWVSMHPDLFPKWTAERARNGHAPAGDLWGARHRVTAQQGVRRIESWGGSSGLLCVRVAIELGCTHIILCGVPMHQNGAHFDNPRKWNEARQYWGPWERNLPAMLGRVKSFHGQTFHWLGHPTKAWIDGDQG